MKIPRRDLLEGFSGADDDSIRVRAIETRISFTVSEA